MLAVERRLEHQRPTQSEVTRIFKVLGVWLAGFAGLYLLFLAIYLRFPNIQPGDNLVAAAKHKMARSGNAFRSPRGSGRLHVMAFGYSKTLAGFIPAKFDSELAAAGFPVESYNFGLPGDSRFVDDLEAMAARGVAPDFALLTFPWPASPEPSATLFHFLNDDQQVMDELFPFRHLPRDLFILAAEANSVHGIRDLYLESERSVQQVAEDRGYYFIARQSHYAKDQLPAGFDFPTDTPDVIYPRVVTLGPIYRKLAAVLAERKIKCVFVPLYFREGEYAAPPGINSATAQLLAQQPDVAVVGPDYWLYPNRYFSDPVHANREGADAYTRGVAALFVNWLKTQR